MSALTKDLLLPLVSVIGHKPDFSAITFTVNGTQFLIGDFLNSCVAFLLAAGAIYFFVVTPVNSMIARMRKDPLPADPTTKKCLECRNEIPIDATRCGHCTQPQLARAA